MERPWTRSMDILSIIDSAYNCNNSFVPMRHECDTKHAFIKIASRHLRMIKISLNDLIVIAPDLEYDEARLRYIDVVRNVIVALMDLFYIAMLDLHSKAYEVKIAMDTRNCYEDYVRSVKSELKT